MNTPKLQYLQDLKRESFVQDSAQQQAVEHLEELYQRLVRRYYDSDPNIIVRFLNAVSRRRVQPEQGLYLWGGVGRGKTYLMDNFYESLPFERKMRVHFHRFMRRVHADLGEFAGRANPLEKVADKIAGEAAVICFDEFFVSDITDAMLLGGLLEALFERGLCLVATSNITPSQLYRNGLQRQRFLPAIALLEKHCKVVNVDGGVDHRLRALEKTELYHSPLCQQSSRAIDAIFNSLITVDTSVLVDTELEIGNRPVPVCRMTTDVAWFDFTTLCGGPRSQNDYIDIAMEFHAVVISDMPALDGTNDDAARRFINLVDEFYDRNVKLVIAAAQPLDLLYSGGKLAFEFQRTKSRLLEMQSYEYLGRPHRPN